jgi:UDP-3-O-[3-hydroxymyristoyl] glucosamine N-acyltransferase
MTDRSFRLEEIASALGAELRGDGQVLITGVATLKAAGPSEIAFLANPNYARYLEDTSAAAVILAPDVADKCPTNVLLLDNPYLGYARLSHWFDRAPVPEQGVHPTAVIDPTAQVADSACLGPHVVIEAGAVIGERVVVGAGCVVGARSQVGEDTVIRPRATLAHDVTVGKRCHILSGAVIGSDGFGFAIENGVWHRISQLGGVVLGDDVEVGANTTIDRGALDSTVIGNGVKLDNLIQIGHNVSIGDNSAMAAMVGIAGSTRIGRHCVFGGATAVGGHLEITDGVQATGMTMITGNIDKPGVYSSGTGSDTNRQWRKNAVRFRQLDRMARKLRELEKKIDG